jgi:arginine/ornithine N-succinyltransferase beta subunit
MKVNLQKTALLTISDAKSYRPQIFIKDTEDNELVSKEGEVKVLGFIFDQTPTVSAQVNNIIRKTRRRYWVLRHLRKFGLSDEELLKVYKSSVRSVIEFTSVVYHPMLTKEQSKDIERLQMQALKCIYGIQHSYEKLLKKWA